MQAMRTAQEGDIALSIWHYLLTRTVKGVRRGPPCLLSMAEHALSRDSSSVSYSICTQGSMGNNRTEMELQRIYHNRSVRVRY